MFISQEQIDTYIQTGSVVVDKLIPTDVIDAASQGMDQLYAESDNPTGIKQYVDQTEITQLLQNPGFENAAKEILGCESVHLLASATLHTNPDQETDEWSFDPDSQHVDIQYTANDWLETPRRIIITFMVFLDDVTPDRAPTVVRPGSHLQIAKHNGDEAYQERPVFYKDLPDLGYADLAPVCGKKGQVAVSTTALVHAGSKNVTDKPRKVLFVVYSSTDVNPAFNINIIDQRLAWLKSMHEQFADNRKHLVESAIEQTEALIEAQAATS